MNIMMLFMIHVCVGVKNRSQIIRGPEHYFTGELCNLIFLPLLFVCLLLWLCIFYSLLNNVLFWICVVNMCFIWKLNIYVYGNIVKSQLFGLKSGIRSEGWRRSFSRILFPKFPHTISKDHTNHTLAAIFLGCHIPQLSWTSTFFPAD